MWREVIGIICPVFRMSDTTESTNRTSRRSKKALNRANDDLVPPAALIPLEKYGRIQEDTQVIKEDKYASHQECCELFPQSSTKTELPVETTNEIKNLLDKRYGQTTYNESFYDQKKNTALSLGPQYQFYPSDDEDAEEDEEEDKDEEGENDVETEIKVENGEKGEEYRVEFGPAVPVLSE